MALHRLWRLLITRRPQPPVWSVTTETGTSNPTYRVGQIDINRDEMAALWWALYLAYGNECPAPHLWNKLRFAAGDQWDGILQQGSDIGRQCPMNDDTAARRGARVIRRLTGLAELPFYEGGTISLEAIAEQVLEAAYDRSLPGPGEVEVP